MHYRIIVDHSETANKCTIVPLRLRPDFSLTRFHIEKPLAPLAASFLLHPDGEVLSPAHASPDASLAAIDCIWRRLPTILRQLPPPWPRLVRIPDGFVTAYPRRSRGDRDPTAGLATIEAIFIAAALLGHWDESLLAQYHFADVFLEANRAGFAAHGISLPPAPLQIARAPKIVHAQARRTARGRVPRSLQMT